MKNQTELFSSAQYFGQPYEYFLLVSPPGILKTNILNLKRKLQNVVGIDSENLFSVPHITLFKFRRPADQEKQVIELAEKALTGEPHFEIKIEGVTGFKSGNLRHLVLKIEPSSSLQRVFGHLRRALGPGSARTSFTPHITIARNMSAKKFEKILPRLNEFNNTSNFICNGITLLGKEIGAGDNYNKIHEVRLN